jgi:hypothetical protein
MKRIATLLIIASIAAAAFARTADAVGVKGFDGGDVSVGVKCYPGAYQSARQFTLSMSNSWVYYRLYVYLPDRPDRSYWTNLMLVQRMSAGVDMGRVGPERGRFFVYAEYYVWHDGYQQYGTRGEWLTFLDTGFADCAH